MTGIEREERIEGVSTMSKEEHVLDLLPGFALNCLDEEEALRTTFHLSECEACRAELASFQKVADRLGYAASTADPPPELKKNLMDSISRGEPLKRRASAGPGKLSGRLGSLPFTWGLAGLLLIVALGLSNLFLWQQVNRMQAAAVSDSFQVVALAGTEVNPDASGMIVISADGKHGTLIVDKLPSLDPGMEYQLWLIEDGNRLSGGTFTVSQDGYASLWVGAPKPLGSFPAFGVTIEPSGGSPAPTGSKVLGGEL